MIQQELHICSIWQSLREGITLALSFTPSTWFMCFPSLFQSDGYTSRWNNFSLRPSPFYVSRSLRRLNVPTYPAGSFLVINSELEAGKRLKFYPGGNQRTRGSQDMCPIRGILGQRPSRFLRISAENRTSCLLQPSLATPFLNLQIHMN